MNFYQDSLQEFSINDLDALCQEYLHIIYGDMLRQKPADVSKNNITTTYGEILYPSINKLMSAISLTEHDVFVDLGAGMGKIVIQFFLKSPVKSAYGIELIPELHEHALKAAQRLQIDLPAFYNHDRQLTFLLGSFLEIPFTTATVVLLNSTCFTQSLLNEVGNIIEKTQSIHTVLSIRPLNTLRRFIFKKAIRIECSWDSALCYVYHAKYKLDFGHF